MERRQPPRRGAETWHRITAVTGGGSTNAYNLMEGMGLTDYSYPKLQGIPHYGDWKAEFESGSLAYYEHYQNGTAAGYGFLGGNVSSLRDDETVLGDGYGMKAASGIGKEWFEQAEALEDWCVGKTVEEVVTMPTYDKGDGRHTQVPDDVDLKTGCTIDMGSFLNALQEAADNAK